jgi:hypothetical protein
MAVVDTVQQVPSSSLWPRYRRRPGPKAQATFCKRLQGRQRGAFVHYTHTMPICRGIRRKFYANQTQYTA